MKEIIEKIFNLMCSTLYFSSMMHPDLYSDRKYRGRILVGINVLSWSVIPVILISIHYSKLPSLLLYIPVVLSAISVLLTYVYDVTEKKSTYSMRDIFIGFAFFIAPFIGIAVSIKSYWWFS
ncbi:hypothetical protein N9N17_03805 [Schleiferiaceae bacterium]|jgi:hypothetical protein|nr:hypothetical protein [Schleiferiaceae bacterium]MDA8825003.1 hypothetical protein [Schleiferiaceae bacterium]MDA8995014.1 hypothetical protein [Schleiferiaceae bacterium]MDB2597553.1 hypothetical protein [Schleiferiaceae bacterium]MDC1225972.1 hypothetical protein [Schleiferiaceae bacterium]